MLYEHFLMRIPQKMSCTRLTRLSETYQTARTDKPCSTYNATACKPQDNREDILVLQRHGQSRSRSPETDDEAEADTEAEAETDEAKRAKV